MAENGELEEIIGNTKELRNMDRNIDCLPQRWVLKFDCICTRGGEVEVVRFSSKLKEAGGCRKK